MPNTNGNAYCNSCNRYFNDKKICPSCGGKLKVINATSNTITNKEKDTNNNTDNNNYPPPIDITTHVTDTFSPPKTTTTTKTKTKNNSNDDNEEENSSLWSKFKKFFGFGSSDSDSSDTASSGGDTEDQKKAEEFLNDTGMQELTNTEDFLKLSLYGGAYGVYEFDYDEGENPEGDAALNAQLKEVFDDLSSNRGDKLDKDTRLDNILGLPLSYNNNADPGKRVYSDTLLYDAPLVYIVPGKPKINKKLISTTGEFIGIGEYYDKVQDGTENENGVFATLSALKGDSRYISFKQNFFEYRKYVQILYSYVYSYIYTNDDTTQGFKRVQFSDVFDNQYNDSGVCFYCDRSTTFSESADNTYGTSRIAEQVNSESSTIREVSMTAYRNGFQEFLGSIFNTVKKGLDKLTTAMSATVNFEDMLTNTSNKFIKVVNGGQLDFPEIWQDSKFSKSYDISFRFYSPYGDKQSIMKYVYLPFLALLAFTLPRQDQAFAYIEPFLVRVYCPGAFCVDMGVITSMTINKGGSDGLWTADGLPQIIEVSISVQDLYPALKQIAKDGMMKYNRSLSMYLETMAGIRPDKLELGRSLKTFINRKVSNSFLTNVDDNVGAKIEDFMYNTMDAINNFLK